MRIVATSDTHFPFDLADSPYIPESDVFVHAGDLMYSGYVTEWAPLVRSLAQVKAKHKYLIPGNHDIHIQLYSGPAIAELRDIGFKVLGLPGKKEYYTDTLPNGMRLLGSPWVTNLPAWAFNADEEYIWDYLNHVGRADIVVSHSPPSGILDRSRETFNGRGSHYGVHAYRKYLKHYQPKHWICGHVHERYGTTEVEGCKFYNVAMCNEDYKQVNKPMVIGL